MKYTKEDISKLDRVSRLKLINSISGVKPANLIGTKGEDGQSNLAIFSSIVHLGSSPALLGFVARPSTEEVGHTLQNIKKSGFYTINHVHPEFIENAHFTSAKFDRETSEFDRCKFNEEYIDSFKAPFVRESRFKIGMRFVETIDIKLNGTVMVIGEVEQVVLPDESLINGDVNLEESNGVGISGLNSYYSLTKIASFPYARVEEVPKF